MLTMSHWDGDISSASLSLAKEFSKTNRVFYIDNPFTVKDVVASYRKPSMKRRMKALFLRRNIYTSVYPGNANLVAVTPKLVLPINWLPVGPGYNAASRINDQVIIDIIRKIKKDYHIDAYILFNSFNPFYSHKLPKDITPALRVYQSRDDISQCTYIDKHGVRLEQQLIRQSDIAIATSRGLVKKLSRLSGKEIGHLPNAADISNFSRVFDDLPKPAELKNAAGKKIIGYIGNVCQKRIDYDLLTRIIDENPDKIVLFVGPVTSKLFYEYGLDRRPNVIMTGPKLLSELPAYLKYINCTIIPFHCNELTKSIYPLKINEYLAGGKPVVSTNFSEDILGFRDVIYLADSHDAFLKLINRALENELVDQDKRIRFAAANSWKSRVDQFWEMAGNTGIAAKV